MQPLAVAGEVGRLRLQVARPVGRRQHDGDRPLHRDVAIEEAERIRHHPRVQVVLARQLRAVEIGVRIVLRVAALRHRQCRHLLAVLVVPLEPAGIGDRHALPRPAEAVGCGELRGALRAMPPGRF